ncbi:MAG: helix-turn-helix transcriptional regulator [Treponema sp.]|jgi:DNA-binding CsgD family transcriptional regulator|nr:helix-turn-helix transcriptional regulator [Treponema sp.]
MDGTDTLVEHYGRLLIMSTINLILWISVYSICLVHITLFAIIYVRHKNKIELFYLIVLSNMFLLAVIIMLSLIFNINNVIPIIINCILLLYITVPLYGYKLWNVNKKYYKCIPIFVLTEVIIENVLMTKNIFEILYLSRTILYILLLVPVFINKKKYEKDSLEWNMQNVTIKTVIIFLAFIIIFIPFSMFLSEISYTSSLWWAAFTLSYQIPGLVYCKKYLLKKNVLSDKTEISSLSKRENEVALAICNGYKYEEIAKKLFISLSAVKKHAFTIYRKLDINNSRELMQIFIESQKNSSHNQ